MHMEMFILNFLSCSKMLGNKITNKIVYNLLSINHKMKKPKFI